MEMFFILLNLVLLEVLLSVDNAAVLAVVVKDLPEKEGKKALKYGLLGAYVFRGLCLLFVSYLSGIWWLKLIGGAYLLWLGISHFIKSNNEEEEIGNTSESKLFKFARKYLFLNKFWATVLVCEMLDIVFSLDNLFAAVALSDQLWVVMVGVFIGIAAIRFVAGFFLKLLKEHPALENSAFIVIALLGVKLVLKAVAEAFTIESIQKVMSYHSTDLIFSAFMILIFAFPLIKDRFKK